MKANRYSVCSLALALLLQFSTANAAENTSATFIHSSQTVAAQADPIEGSKEDFIEDMGKKVLDILKDKKKSFSEKQATLRGLFTEVVDTNWIAKFVLGASWKTATPEQKERYIELYRTYLTETYISKFDDQSGSKVKDIKVLGIKDAPGNAFVAHTVIVQSEGENVSVDYMLKGKNGDFKIIDITIEGISLLATHRNQFSALAASGGMESVIAKLKQLISQKE